MAFRQVIPRVGTTVPPQRALANFGHLACYIGILDLCEGGKCTHDTTA